MAFEQNLEADRVDGFNIFSAFVRVPLLVLGGILGAEGSSTSIDVESDVDKCSTLTDQEDCAMDICTSSGDEPGTTCTPDCMGTKRLDHRQPSNSKLSSQSLQQKLRENDTGQNQTKLGMKRTRKMSWSDESGLPLVYERDESVSHHDPNSNPYSSASATLHKPTKSAMRKSKSIRQGADGLTQIDRDTSINRSRYIPNMNPRTAGKGFVIPTRPYGGHSSIDSNKPAPVNGAEMSPQWGWYINTTPPTPELYQTRSSVQSSSVSSLNKGKSVKGKTFGVQPPNERYNAKVIDPKACQNEVFQNLQNSTKANPLRGWTSIPI